MGVNSLPKTVTDSVALRFEPRPYCTLTTRLPSHHYTGLEVRIRVRLISVIVRVMG